MNVIKRNGSKEEYNSQNIESALKKSFKACNKKISESKISDMISKLEIHEDITTESIQNQLEEILAKEGYLDVVRFFIAYRYAYSEKASLKSKTDFMDQYLSASNAASGSKYDANANVTEKNVTTLSAELYKGEIIKLNRNRLYNRIKEMYGKKLAEEYLQQLDSHLIYKHDESSIMPYCVAITMYPFLLNGLGDLGGLSSVPKNLESFCGSFVNLVFAIGAGFAGAVATAEFLPYFNHFAEISFGKDYIECADEFYTIGPKLREFIKKTDVPFKEFVSVKDLEKYDFGELNSERDELVKEITRPATQEELSEWNENFANGGNFSLKLGDGSRTIKSTVEQYFQQIVYSINQPAAARGYQSLFWNIGYFDEGYFNGIFSDFEFPDGSKMNFSNIKELQKIFMRWFNQERTKAVLTFPVESFSLLIDPETKKFKDQESADFVAEMYSLGHSFFTYMSDSADALSSCCFSGDTKTLTRSSDGVNFMTFKEIYEAKSRDCKKNFSIFHNGSWVKGKTIMLPNRKMFKVKTSNNKEFIVSDNHLNCTLRGDIETSNLTTDDYILFNSRQLSAIPERDENLSYEEGFIVGAFLGDGSFGYKKNDGTRSEIVFDVNKKKQEKIFDILSKVNDKLSDGEYKNDIRLSFNSNSEESVKITLTSKNVVEFVQKWTNWKEGVKANSKEVNMNCVEQSADFRKGILEGIHFTDGTDHLNRIYTTSKLLSECLEAICTSLGYISTIYEADRAGEKVITIRGIQYNRNYPSYCIGWYSLDSNKREMHDVYKVRNNSQYFKINSIEEVEYEGNIYCFEMKNTEEPYFTLPNGVITHNCRLKNKVQENTFSNSFGAGGVATGSKSVMTININHLIQDAVKEGKDYLEVLREEIQKVHKFQTAFNSLIEDLYKKKALPAFSAGFISLDKQYLTLGVNGVVEAAEFLGIQAKPTEEYEKFITDLLGTFTEENKKARTKKLMFNTELTK